MRPSLQSSRRILQQFGAIRIDRWMRPRLPNRFTGSGTSVRMVRASQKPSMNRDRSSDEAVAGQT